MNDKQPERAAEANDTNETSEHEAAPAAAAEADAATSDRPDARDEELEALRAELAETSDKLLRAMAELDNLRKRTRREVVDSRRFAQADLLRPMLEVLDNFERALATDASHEADDAAARHDSFRQGVEMIALSFRQALRDHGVEAIAAEGEAFDPTLHEAVGQQPAPEDAEAGTVMAVVQRGYTLGDLVLRPSRVIVAQ